MSRFNVQCLPVLALCLVASFSSLAQTPATETALRFLQTNYALFQLTAADVSDVKVTDSYLTQHNGVTHVWFQQQYKGIPVFKALIGLHVTPDGKVVYLGHRFTQGLESRINTTMPSLSAYQALELAMKDLGFAGFAVPTLREKINEQNWVFEGGAVSRSPIPVTIVYQALADGTVHLSWMLVIDQANTSDIWSMRIDALSGKVLDKINRTSSCMVPAASAAEPCSPDMPEKAPVERSAAEAAGTYRVYPLPTESPYHGPQLLVSDPANPTASPFGWHDTNGAPGAEYNYTRGNNVWAYSDAAGDNQGSEAESAAGGANLVFDYLHNPNAEPLANINAAVTNLFYTSNMMHDIFYLYGFDEAAGNFQVNNYGHSGAAGDPVNSEAIDASGQNNANFAPAEDGFSGRLQMYEWTRPVQVTGNAPDEIAGNYYASPANGWAGTITATGITAQVILVDDGTANPNEGCNPLVNNLAGKIGMVDRGTCQFSEKALNAQNAGAIGCIICNYEDAYANMGPGNFGGLITIPVVMMAKSNCELLKQHLNEGVNLTVAFPVNNGPNFYDGDFDNGIITHEYGHGISQRLTGGPATVDCLSNGEQMGEGWSDWFALVTTAKQGDTGAKERPIGTYVYRQSNTDSGIRRHPYSTDMSINPLTYGSVAENTEMHALGEVWTAMAWDLYWAMVEKYGFDPDITNTASGNGRAIQLVMGGMKLQPCSPGFTDGRDAIIMADKIDYAGADTCLISEVFARRGLGILASEGSTEKASDGTENFDPIPTCVKELKIKKITSSPTIDPGGNATFLITVTNHKDSPVTNVVVTDPLPAGLHLEFASNGGALNGNLIVWNLGTLAPGAVVTLNYTTKSINPNGSIRLFRDEMENDGQWLSNSLDGDQYFYPQTTFKKTGDYAWRADDAYYVTDFTAEYQAEFTVSGVHPALRFWNRYDTEKGADAGFIEIRKSGDQKWAKLNKTDGLRNGFPAGVQYTTFAIPYLYAFSGVSGGWIQSYFDLSAYVGQAVTVRFRFGSNESVPGDGWMVDDLELLDLLNYNSEACVSSNEGDQACASAPESGVIVNPGTYISTTENTDNTFTLAVQPNPASDIVLLTVGKALSGNTRVTMVGMDGRVVVERRFNGIPEGQVIALDVENVPAGVYSVRVDNAEGRRAVKVAVR